MITIFNFLLTCSRRRFTEQQAELCWAEHRSTLQEQYGRRLETLSSHQEQFEKRKGVLCHNLRLTGAHSSLFLPATVYISFVCLRAKGVCCNSVFLPGRWFQAMGAVCWRLSSLNSLPSPLGSSLMKSLIFHRCLLLCTKDTVDAEDSWKTAHHRWCHIPYCCNGAIWIGKLVWRASSCRMCAVSVNLGNSCVPSGQVVAFPWGVF